MTINPVDRITELQEEKPINSENKPKVVTKNQDGSLKVDTDNGSFTVPAQDAEIQAFVLFCMINNK